MTYFHWQPFLNLPFETELPRPPWKDKGKMNDDVWCITFDKLMLTIADSWSSREPPSIHFSSDIDFTKLIITRPLAGGTTLEVVYTDEDASGSSSDKTTVDVELAVKF